MHIALGIDTGGTYTDAVLVNQTNGQILAKTKALTTHRDLAIGIQNAIAGVFEPAALLINSTPPIQTHQIGMVGLSTTLATNAIVEGQGSNVCLLLIGYNKTLIQRHNFARDLVTPDVVYLRGGHDGEGNEIAPLDEAAARDAILARRDHVAAFAVSGYFSVRNPAHELRVKALVEELTAQNDQSVAPYATLAHPVTCGHELTTKLNSVRRATTVALNARLIPVLRNLILTVRQTLDTHAITAPLMIVKGDGSLVCAKWAIQRPIETILSGPAASVVGAWHVAGRKDVWVVDVGGTTTDIAALRDGRPRLNPHGAHVGGWRTMVEAADVHTVGLGGDSHVQIKQNGHAALTIGPQRVLPLSRLGNEYPEIMDELRRQVKVQKSRLKPLMGQFILTRRAINGLSDKDQALLAELQNGPRSLVWLAQQKTYRPLLAERVARLVAQQAIFRAAFTPTDALHVLGHFVAWDEDAARLGAALLAAQQHESIPAFCENVRAAMSNRVATEVISKVIHDEVAPPDWNDPVAAGLLARALNPTAKSDLACQLSLQQPVVAVGAPVRAYLPRATARLHTELVIPDAAGVANAIGAVAGSVVQRVEVLIRPINFGEFYRLYVPGHLHIAQRDFETLEACVEYALASLPEQVAQLAQEAGAEQVEVNITRDDHTATLYEEKATEDSEETVFLETVLIITAVGRPGMTIPNT